MGESQSTGIIERAVGLVAGQARTLKAALEHRIGARVPPHARILCWLVEFAAYLMNRCDVGSDGKTPLQRLHGRRDNTPILEVGEKILCMPAKSARGGKWEPRFHSGVFVGMLNSSSEAHRARNGDQDTHGQHQKNPRVGKMGRRRKTESTTPPLVSRWQRQRIRHPRRNGEAAEMVPRLPGDVLMDNKAVRTHLRRADFEQWGLSEGCPGCRYLRTGQGRQQAHSEACRRRIEGLLRGDSAAHDWLQ